MKFMFFILIPILSFGQDWNYSSATKLDFDFPIKQCRIVYPKTMNPTCAIWIGGQSNAVGTGDTLDLTDQTLVKKYQNVFILNVGRFGGTNGQLQKYRTGENSNDENRGWVGLETGLIDSLIHECNGQDVHILKTAFPATSLSGGWSDTGGRRQQSIRGYRNFIAELYKKGLYPDWKCLVWMQGESDARQTQEVAENYYENLKDIMTYFRNNINFYCENISIVRIHQNPSQQPFQHIVRAAQLQFVNAHQNYNWVNSDDIPRQGNAVPSVSLHYTSDGYIQLSQRIFLEKP